MGIEIKGLKCDIHSMSKRAAFKKIVRDASTGGFVVRTIAGVMPDGVVILKSPGRATHFTDKELSEAVRSVSAGKHMRGVNAGKAPSFKKG